MASIWQKQAKLGDFSKIVQVLIESEFEEPKAVNSCNGNETTLKLMLTKGRRKNADLLKINVVF